MEKQNPFLRLYGCCLIIEGAIIVIIALMAPPLALTAPIAAAIALGLCIPTVLLLYVLSIRSKRKVKEDERSLDIAQRSSLIAYLITVPQLFVFSVLTYIVDGEPFGWGYYVRTTLVFVAGLMIIVCSLSYLIINRGMQKNG